MLVNVNVNVNATNIQRDANGNTLNDGVHSYAYNTYNRLIGVDTNVSYQYNALGQRAAKDVSGTVTSFAYGLGGELLGEYEAGIAQAEHVYLGGQPLAVMQNGNVYYIHSDHLGTPRVISDQNQTAVWQWESDPFGASAANDDVNGDGVAFVYNKRFAGQYYDSETGLHYNYFRYYDPSTGQYITSDPLGVRITILDPELQVATKATGIDMDFDMPTGSINHLYAYVSSNPLIYSDYFGLHHKSTHRWRPTPNTGPFVSLGDVISLPNGNWWGEFEPQDGTCSLWIFSPIGNACFPEKCERHDGCYTDNKYNATSWIINLLGGTKPCNQCNSDFFD